MFLDVMCGKKTQIYCRSQVQMERLSFISGSSANEEEDEDEEGEEEVPTNIIFFKKKNFSKKGHSIYGIFI